MRILYVVNGYPTAENPHLGCFVKEQIDGVGAAGVEVGLINIQGRGVRKYLRAIRSVREQARMYDIVHAQHMLCGLVAIAAGARKRLVTSFMSDGAANLRGKSRLFGHLLFHAASVLSRRCIYKSQVHPWYRAKSIYLPNGVDTEHFRPIEREHSCAVLDLDPSRRYAMFVSAGGVSGSLRAVKRYDLFQRMLRQLQAVDPRWTELLVTTVTRDFLPFYYNAADALLLTSDAEGSPNAVKEALACGTPVVARDVGDVRMLLADVPSTICFTLDGWAEARDFLLGQAVVSPSAIREAFMRKAIDKAAVNGRLIDLYQDMLSSCSGRV